MEWLSGTGEMAGLIHAHDWSATLLGPIDGWSEGVRTVVELMLESPMISTVALTADRLLLYNDHAAKLYGARHPAALGRSLADTFPDSYPAVAELYDRVFAGESVAVHQQPLAVSTGNGREMFDAYLTPIRTSDGAVVGAHMVGFEVGARTRADLALRESEARLAAAFESVPVGVAAIDLSGAAVIANAEYRRFLPSGLIPSRDPERLKRWQAWDDQGQGIDPQDFPGARAIRGESVVPGLEMLFTDDEGQERWTSVATAPTRDDYGRVTGAVTAISDIDLAKRSGEALQQSEERFRQFGEASHDVLWIRNAATSQWEYLTPAFETIYGLAREVALRGDNLVAWLHLVLPEDREHASASLQRVLDGEWVTFEYRIRRPADGQVRWLRNTDFPIQDASGKVVRVGGIGHDITEFKRTEEALAAAELRQRILMEGIPQLVWRSCDKGLWTWASPQWLTFTGQDQEQSHGRGWLDAIHPDDRATAMQAWEEARPHGTLDVEYRVRHAGDNAWVWHHTRSVPVRDADGRILEWLGTSTDIQKLRELQDQQHVLVAELQHRTRNLMGVVRSMSDKTARASASLPDFRARFRDRLEALARVQGLLSRLHEHDRVTFDELIEAELAAMDGAAGRVTLEGPHGVRLRSSMVQTLAMALHELATNAVKYGALGQPQARLTLRWSVEPSGAGNRPRLHIEWQETGVKMPPIDAKPSGGGQGRELIERALPYQLSAETTYELGPDGVRCTISIPVSASNPREVAHA